MSVKFSQFNDETLLLNTDIVVGLRGVINSQFPIVGIGDSAGNKIITWTQASGTNTNWIDFTNSNTNVAPIISAKGNDSNINLSIGAKGTGHVFFSGTGAVGVPVGTTAQEPTGFAGGLRYDTDTDYLRYWDIGANAWVDIIAGAAFDDATYVTNTDETADLPNSQPLSALSTGIMRVTTATGIIDSLAIPLIATLGGTGIATYTLGDTLYSSAANTLAKLAGNITTTKQYLSQTGDGALSAAPIWSTISGGDITGAALTRVDDTNVTLTLGGTPTTALLRAASITAGWTGQLSAPRGGTGIGTYVVGDILYASATNALSALAGNITTGKQFLSQTGSGAASAAPAWATISGGDITGAALTRVDDTNVTLTLGGAPSTALLAATSLTLGWTGTLAVSRGGTGLSSATNSAVLLSTNAGVPVWSSTMTDGQLIIGSTGATPVAASLTAGSGVSITPGAGTITISATGSGGTVTSVSGTANQIDSTGGATPVLSLSSTIIAPGSLAVTALTASTAIVANASKELTSVALTNGQLLIGSTGVAPVAASLTAGTNVTITPGAGTITISASGGLAAWTDVTGATQTLAVNNGYITNRGGGVTYTLPATAALGDQIAIVGKLGLATIAQNANQQILASSASSTVGVTGTFVSTNVGDTITLICITAGASTVWRANSIIGNWTVT